jgi:Family of unknown function (DUF6263)
MPPQVVMISAGPAAMLTENGPAFHSFSRKDRWMRENLTAKTRAGSARLAAAKMARPAGVAVVAVVVSLLGLDARAQEVLRWKLKNGDVLKYSAEQKQVMNVKHMGRERKQTRAHTIDYTWSVTAVLANGDADVTQKIEHVTMKVSMPPYMPFEYDSNSPNTDVPEPFEGELQMLKATIGAELSFKMTPSGEIADVKIPDATLKKLRDALPKEGGPDVALSEQVLKERLISSSPPPFPQQPLEVGKNWSSKPSKLAFPGLFTMVTDKVFTFHGPDPKNPRLMLVGMDGRVTLEVAENVAARILSQDGKGNLVFDAESGHIVSTRLTQKLDMSMSMNGQEIEQLSETSSTMTLVR